MMTTLLYGMTTSPTGASNSDFWLSPALYVFDVPAVQVLALEARQTLGEFKDALTNALKVKFVLVLRRVALVRAWYRCRLLRVFYKGRSHNSHFHLDFLRVGTVRGCHFVL